jgi:hypothetical protein
MKNSYTIRHIIAHTLMVSVSALIWVSKDIF